jgi:hypothetical protein
MPGAFGCWSGTACLSGWVWNGWCSGVSGCTLLGPGGSGWSLFSGGWSFSPGCRGLWGCLGRDAGWCSGLVVPGRWLRTA